MPQPPKSASCNYKPVNNLRQTPSVRAASCRNAAEPTSAFASNKAMQPLAHFNAAREDTYKQNKTFRCAQTAGQTQQPPPVFGQLNLIVAPKPNRCSTPHKKANLSPISAPKIEISSRQRVRRSVSPHRDLSDSHSFAYSTFGHAKRGNINTNRNIAAKHIQQQTARRARLSCRAKEVSTSAVKQNSKSP